MHRPWGQKEVWCVLETAGCRDKGECNWQRGLSIGRGKDAGSCGMHLGFSSSPQEQWKAAECVTLAAVGGTDFPGATMEGGDTS